MDFASIGGLIFGIVMIAVGAYFEHVTIESIVGISAFLIVFGGTLGVTALSHTMAELKSLPSAIKMIFFPPKMDYPGMITYLVGLADQARRKGLLSLQDEVDAAQNELIKRGLTLVVDGSDPEVVHDMLDAMLEVEEEHGMHASHIFVTAGGYCPTIGIMGTVMGLVQVMGNLSEPETLGPAIAVAFLATLYGVGFANVIFLPFGSKIKHLVKQQSKFNEMVIAGVVAIQSGENPRNLKEKLLVYAGVSDHSKGQQSAQQAKGQTVEEGT